MGWSGYYKHGTMDPLYEWLVFLKNWKNFPVADKKRKIV